MKKTYKLLKWYPSLPEKLEVGDVVEYSETFRWYSSIHGLCVNPSEVENNPEFWEKIREELQVPIGTRFVTHRGDNIYTVDKTFANNEVYITWDGGGRLYGISTVNELFNDGDWKKIQPHQFLNFEIITFKDSAGNKYRSDGNGLYSWSVDNKLFDFEELMDEEFVHIHSVKRLSDGTIFTVGDKISSHGFTGHNEVRTILKFNPSDPVYIVIQNWGVSKINDIEHVKKAVFITHDGVDIYEGDKIYSVNNITPKVIFNDFIVTADFKPRNEVYNYFSSKSSALDWIEENEKKYSENDIRKLHDYSREVFYTVNQWIEFLNENKQK